MTLTVTDILACACLNMPSHAPIYRTELGMLQPSLLTQKALLKKQNGRERLVTIKSPDPAETEAEGKILLLQEAVIIGQTRHPNVVQVHGVIMEDSKVCLLVVPP